MRLRKVNCPKFIAGTFAECACVIQCHGRSAHLWKLRTAVIPDPDDYGPHRWCWVVDCCLCGLKAAVPESSLILPNIFNAARRKFLESHRTRRHLAEGSPVPLRSDNQRNAGGTPEDLRRERGSLSNGKPKYATKRMDAE